MSTSIVSEDLYQMLVANVTDYGIITLDTEGRVTTWNPGAESIKGYRAEEILGEHFSRFYPEEDVQKGKPEEELRIAAEKGRLEDESWRVKKDGTRFWANVVVVALRDKAGKLCGYGKLTRDLTDRKRAEEASYARGLIEASLDPLVTISPEGRITDVNKATEEVTGVVREALIGSDFCDYFTEPKNARQGYEKVLSEGLVRDYPLTIRHASGKTTDVLYNATIYRDEAGNVQGVFAAARDVTERKRFEETLARQAAQEALAQQAQEILDISTPILQVWEGVVVAPLIGTLDSQRTQQFMEKLLSAIVETNSPVALVDITGVPTIDTQTAQHLLETISAVRLLGAQVLLTGVRPAIAQALVHLGIDLSEVTTRPSLAAGLRIAMELAAPGDQ